MGMRRALDTICWDKQAIPIWRRTHASLDRLLADHDAHDLRTTLRTLS